MATDGPEIELYTLMLCSYCAMAKRLLRSKGAVFTEIDVSTDSQLRAALVKRTGGQRTLPQIFVGGQHLGGYDDIAALDKKGALDGILSGRLKG